MSNRRLATPTILAALFLATWAPRLLVLQAFVTADERKWLNRSGNFYWALSQGEWAETFQKAHPGVTVTWVGLIAFVQAVPDYLRRVTGPITDHALETMLWQEGPLTPLALLAVGRWWMVLAISLMVAAMYLPLRKLYGRLAAAIGVLFVAWSPFFLGLSHHLHPDGPLAALSILSLLLFLAWLYTGQQRCYLIASALVFGLALLTKTPAVGVGLTVGLLVLIESFRRWRGLPGDQRTLWRGAIVWGLIALATFVLLWPVMWVDPLGALRQIYDQMQGYRVEGHSLPGYFMGQIIDDPGWLFYPAVLLLRISPVTLIGIGLAIWFFVSRKQPYQSPAARWATVGNLLFSLVIITLAAVSAKKFDRYILPAFLTLDLVAATGWVGLVLHLLSTWRATERPDRFSKAGLRPWLGGTILAMVVVSHGLPAFLQFPYYALAFNPLVGGKRLAPRVLMIGWGEGLNEVGHWLSQQERGDPLRVVSWYEDGPLSYFLPGDSHLMSFIESDNYWFDADYVVLYANQWQRENPDPEMVDHFLNQEPLFSADANGLELAKVYDNRRVAPPPFTQLYTDSRTDFANQLQLVAYRLPKTSVVPGEELDITLFLKAISIIEQNYDALAELVDGAGNLIWQEQRWPSGMPTEGWPLDQIRQDRYAVSIPADAAVGEYVFQLSLFDEKGDGTLPVGGVSTISNNVVQVATIEVQTPQPVAVDARWAPVMVEYLAHAPVVKPGQTLLVNLDAGDIVGESTKLSLRLVDPTSKTQAQQDKDLSETLRFELAVPANAPAGQYELSVVVYDGDTFEAYPDQDGGTPTTVSLVEVAGE